MLPCRDLQDGICRLGTRPGLGTLLKDLEEFFLWESNIRSHRLELQSHTVQLNLNLLLWMQVCAWMVFPLSISGIWLLKYYTLP